jgi:sulfate adenylyltransferase subunit 2
MRNHLKTLEAEAIDILREVVASSEGPVMPYSIGKDSSVLLHLARKVFYPSHLRDMIRFGDEAAARHDLELLTYTNMEALAAGVTPFAHSSVVYTDLMKTEALRQALDRWKFDAPSRSFRINPPPTVGTPKTSILSPGACSTPV